VPLEVSIDVGLAVGASSSHTLKGYLYFAMASR